MFEVQELSGAEEQKKLGEGRRRMLIVSITAPEVQAASRATGSAAASRVGCPLTGEGCSKLGASTFLLTRRDRNKKRMQTKTN